MCYLPNLHLHHTSAISQSNTHVCPDPEWSLKHTRPQTTQHDYNAAAVPRYVCVGACECISRHLSPLCNFV